MPDMEYGFIRPLLRRRYIPYLILGVMLATTIIISILTHHSARAAEELIFSQRADTVRGQLERRLSTYIALLRAGAGVYHSQGYLNKASWRRFADELHLASAYPGIQGVGFSRRLTSYNANPTKERHAILYLEPLDDRNKAAIGFNMFSEPVRREAMIRARDGHQPALSGKVVLVQEIYKDKQAGFLIYYPVYRRPVTSVADRREALVGYIYSPFRAGDFVVSALDEKITSGTKVEIFDGNSVDQANLLYILNSEIKAVDTDLTILRQVTVAGHTWTLKFTAPDATIITPQEEALPFIFFGGIIISLTFFGLSLTQQRDREFSLKALANLRRAHDRARFLAKAGRILASSLDYEETLENVARAAVPAMADWCGVDIIDNGKLEHLVVVHKDPSKVATAKLFREKYPINWEDQVGLAPAIRNGKTEFYPEITDEMISAVAQDSDHLAIMRELNFKSVIVVPIKVRDTVIGAITLVISDSDYQYTEQDVATAESLASRASLNIANSKLVQELHRAISVRDDFMAIASHELKTPLTSVRGYLQLMERSAGEASEAVKNYVSKANLYVDRLANLIEELLDISRLQSGKLELKEENFPLKDILTDGIESVRYINIKHHVEITGEQNLVVRGDKTRLEQVIINLLSNAIKYSPEANLVKINVGQKDGFAEVSVQDFGIGIPVESLAHVFDRFYRVEHPHHTFTGLGIGLYISRSIIERHGGEMWVESAGAGAGSTFYFTLPLS